VRYTEAGDAALERSISELMDDIVERARAVPELDSVLLGGSLGRGEGTVLHGPGGDRLASDVEVYLVGRSPSLRGAARRLEADLAANHAAEISAAWLHPDMLRRGRAKNLSWRPSRTIRLYELAMGSRTLLGSPPAIHRIDPATLPLGEGVRLVLNRLAEAAPELASRSPRAARWTDKILVACGDTLLLAKGAYTVQYRDRVARLNESDAPWPMPDGWRGEVTAAYERKLTGSAADAGAAPDADGVVVATLAAAVERVTGEPLEPLPSFPRRFVVAGARRSELLRYLPPIGPKATFEGLVLVARAWRAGHRVTSRMLTSAVAGRPLSLALQATALPLYLGLARADPALVHAAAEALVWAGLPAGEVRAADGPVALARLLRHRWAVAT
jgi:hypothetical protein